MTKLQHIAKYGRDLDLHRKTPGGWYSLGNCVLLCKTCHGPQPRRNPGERECVSGKVRTYRFSDDTYDLIRLVADHLTATTGIKCGMTDAIRISVQNQAKSFGITLPAENKRK